MLGTEFAFKVFTITSQHQVTLIAKNLQFSEKLGGRGLVRNVPELNLPAGARLEPSPELLDVGKFEDLAIPTRVIFWKDSRRILHVSPLVRVPGVSHDSWRIDLLHAWQLGPVEKYVGLSFQVFLSSELFHPNTPHLDKDEKQKLALLHLKSLLLAYYAKRRQEDPHWTKKGSEVP